MECPVCYDREPTCKLTCSHALCLHCVEKWYERGSDTCPVCRRTMCFRGLHALKRQWYEKRKEAVFTDLIGEIFEDLEDTDDMDFFIQCLGIIQDRYNLLMKKYPELDPESLEWVLRITWLNVDFLLNRPSKRDRCVPIEESLMFVSKTDYGIKNKRHNGTKYVGRPGS